jgi:hypothetical protein
VSLYWRKVSKRFRERLVSDLEGLEEKVGRKIPQAKE